MGFPVLQLFNGKIQNQLQSITYISLVIYVIVENNAMVIYVYMII